LLGEEVGELFKAVRKSEGLAVDENSSFTEIGDELTDILIYLCAVANRKGIDLEKAFREKEEKNKKRTWKTL
jgi:NTP pyrophosphatase (non-canonical NTP hydrolase)